jgi:hypothetical protein
VKRVACSCSVRLHEHDASRRERASRLPRVPGAFLLDEQERPFTCFDGARDEHAKTRALPGGMNDGRFGVGEMARGFARRAPCGRFEDGGGVVAHTESHAGQRFRILSGVVTP